MSFNISELKARVANNETGEVIDILRKGLNKIQSEQLKTDLNLISGRWKNYESVLRTGRQDDATLGIEQQKINHALLSLLSAIDAEQKKGGGLPVPKRMNWKHALGIAAAVIAVLAGLAQITGLNVLYFLDDQPEQTEITTDSLDKTSDENIQTGTDVKESDTSKVSDSSPPTVSDNSEAIPKTQKEPRTVQNKSPDKLTIQTKTDKGTGTNTYTGGETMRLYFKVNKPCLMRIIYKLADGTLVLFENDLQINSEQVGKYIELGDGYEAAEPYGDESIYFFVQTDPFPKLVTEMTPDGYLEIKEGLQKSLTKTRGMKKKKYFAESTINLITKQ